MKVLHIVQNLDCGGLEHLVVQMAPEQLKRGAQVSIICLGAEGDLAPIAREKGIAVFSLGHKTGFSPALILKLKRAIAGFDLIHTHNMTALIYGSLAARLTGVKCINTRHGRAPRKMYSFIWNLNEFVVAVSEDAKTRMMEFNRINPNRVRVIHNGVRTGEGECLSQSTQSGAERRSDAPRSDRGGRVVHREEMGVPEGTFVIGTVGRLSPEKNQSMLLKAFSELKKQLDDTCLLIVGDGSERSVLEQQAVDLGIQNDVKFLGYRDDVSSLMASMDLFVLPSLEEGLSLTLLEAMSASLPVVATDVGGNGEAVVDGETGVLVPSGDANALAAAMRKINHDKELRLKMGAAGCKRVAEHFSLECMVDKYMELYDQALG